MPLLRALFPRCCIERPGPQSFINPLKKSLAGSRRLETRKGTISLFLFILQVNPDADVV
jgi:hypothetical protein